MNAYLTGIGFVTSSCMGSGRDCDSFVMNQGSLPVLTRKMIFDNPYKPFGRMDLFSKLGLAAIAFAMRDAKSDSWNEKRNIGIIASSVYGSLDTDIKYYKTVIPDEGKRSSPNLFAYTLPNCFLGETAICFGLTGETTVLNEQVSGTTACLKAALETFEFGESEAMICGICDTQPEVDFHVEPPVIPGSLFFVLERKKRETIQAYGELAQDDNRILLNGEEVTDLLDLTRKCINPTTG